MVREALFSLKDWGLRLRFLESPTRSLSLLPKGRKVRSPIVHQSLPNDQPFGIG